MCVKQTRQENLTVLSDHNKSLLDGSLELLLYVV